MMIAAMAFPTLRACRGIELLENLAALGNEVTSKLTQVCEEQKVELAPITV